ncbi:MAG: VCBS repeat-containing protein [Pyrinomonadaceae bacterium]|nr:VCBS repeat-containing protein [Pyrinomonadaceae bacterium]
MKQMNISRLRTGIPQCRFFVYAAVIAMFITVSVQEAYSDTFVFPHLLEQSGDILTATNTFDTQIYVTYLADQAGTGGTTSADVNIYIFDHATGEPMESATNVQICNPCEMTLDSTNRKAVGTIDGLLTANGGFPNPTMRGFMIVDVNGDAGNVVAGAQVLSSDGNPNELHTLALHPREIGPPVSSNTFTIPHYLVDPSPSGTPFSYGQQLILTFVPESLISTAFTGSTSATVNLRIYDEVTGLPLRSATNEEVCNPCSFGLDETQLSHIVDFKTLIHAAGGPSGTNTSGFATLAISGDANRVFVGNLSTNIHSDPLDVSFFDIEPQEQTSSVPLNTFVVPHFLEQQGTIVNTQNTFDSGLFVSYVGGLPGFPDPGGSLEASVTIHLFDSDGNRTTNDGQTICPSGCQFPMDSNTRKRSLRFDDLITNNGMTPFDTLVKIGFAVLVVEGDTANVNLLSFVTQADQSPFNISPFGFQPQEIASEAAFSVIGGGNSRSAKSIGFESRRMNQSPEGGPAPSKVLGFPHFSERPGTTDTTNSAVDTIFHISYSAGLPLGSTGAAVDIYLFDELTSQPLQSATAQDVCNPCTFSVGSGNPKETIVVDDLITSAGGFPRPDINGYAVAVINGATGNTAVLGTLVNSHSGVGDGSIANLVPREIVQSTVRPRFDFDGDFRTDLSIFRPGPGEWWYLRSSDLTDRAFQFGDGSDMPVPHDYTGDGKADIAFFRPATSEWFVLRSEDSSFFAFPFGASGDIPVPGDYDGDGKADPAVFRPGSNLWFINRSSDQNVDIIQFGANGDQPVVGDFDGDSKDDVAIYRPSNAEFWIRQSTLGLKAFQFGDIGDWAFAEDFTGDGKADIGRFKESNGNWFILRSEDDSFFAFPFGANGDIPVPGDYDGDGRADPAVFRPSNSTWFVNGSGSGIDIRPFGTGGDIPLPVPRIDGN